MTEQERRIAVLEKALELAVNEVVAATVLLGSDPMGFIKRLHTIKLSDEFRTRAEREIEEIEHRTFETHAREVPANE